MPTIIPGIEFQCNDDFVQISWPCCSHGRHTFAGNWKCIDALVAAIVDMHPLPADEREELYDALHEEFTALAVRYERDKLARRSRS